MSDERELISRLREAVRASRRVVVALDDDPTGVQTVHDTPVLTVWDVEALAEELRILALDPHSPALIFILTNSRAMTAADAARINREIARNVRAALECVNGGRPNQERIGVVFASRSDSTLRGHFPVETDALADELGGVDGVLIVPAFFDGGRVTAGDIHYVRDGDRLTPAAETEFAKDATFGYRNSNLRDWVEEKTAGRVRSNEVTSLTLPLIRDGGPGAVRDLLLTAENRQPIIVNAENDDDLTVVALGVLDAEAAGKPFIYRTAASFVRVRVGMPTRPQLTRAELLGPQAPPYVPGLVVVGSHVRRTSEQLEPLLQASDVVGIELSVAEILAGEGHARSEVGRSTVAAITALGRGRTPVIYTSRQVERMGTGEDQLTVSQAVSAALVEIVRGVEGRPGFIVGKGGITASDVGAKGLGARRAVVLGQIRPGVPVWRLGPETSYPGLPYIVFPGNVGAPDTLAEVVMELRGAAKGVSREA